MRDGWRWVRQVGLGERGAGLGERGVELGESWGGTG